MRQVAETRGVSGGERSAGLCFLSLCLLPRRPTLSLSLRSFPPLRSGGGWEGRLASRSRHVPGPRRRRHGRTREGGGRCGDSACEDGLAASRARSALSAAAPALPSSRRLKMERGLLAPARPPQAPLARALFPSGRVLSSALGAEWGAPGTALPLVEAAGPVGPVALDAATRHLSLPQSGRGRRVPASRHGGRPCRCRLSRAPVGPASSLLVPGLLFSFRPLGSWFSETVEGRRGVPEL